MMPDLIRLWALRRQLLDDLADWFGKIVLELVRLPEDNAGYGHVVYSHLDACMVC